MNKADPTKAVIYCRVSSDRQVREGDGLKSQETACREYAEKKGIAVVKVFRDGGVSGVLRVAARPATKDLFAFLDTHREPHFVIVDDLSRLARDTEVGLEFIAKLKMRGAVLVSPTQRIEDTPAGKLVVTTLMATNAYQRDANLEQVRNRQKARLQNGYWVFGKPLGYRYVKDVVGGGKVMVRDEPKASVIAEALEGFASGRFEAQQDVERFLAMSGAFGKTCVNGSRVKRLLTNVLYAGYLEYPKWDVALRQGKHPALISMQVYQRVQERLGLRAKASARADLNADFPLRGFILCACCEQPMTGAYSTSRSKARHPYYRCKNTTCQRYGKGMQRAKVEMVFEDALGRMRPSEPVLRLAEAVVRDCLKKKRNEHVRRIACLERELKDAAQAVSNLAGLLAKTADPALIKIYENQIKEQERSRQMLAAQIEQFNDIDTSHDAALGTVLDFLGNPLAVWKSGDLDNKRLVLKLAFAKRVPFDPETGLGTAVTSLPFTVFQALDGQKGKMVDTTGIEPVTPTMSM